jgi:hypothetical protein
MKNARVTHQPMTRRFYGILLPFLAGSVATLFLFLPGSLIAFLFGILSLVLLFGVTFSVIGIISGRFFPEQSWRSGIWLGIPYLFWLAFTLFNIYFFNRENNGVFLRVEFFPVAAFLYVFPILTACAGAYFGSDNSRNSVSVLAGGWILTFAAVVYVGLSSTATKKDIFSFDFLEGDELHLQVEVTCERMIGKNYMSFFNTDRSDCSYSKISVLKKPRDYSLPTNISLTIENAKESRPIWPEIGILGVTNSFRQDFDNTKVWVSDIPWLKIAKSDRVNFTWGKINIDLEEPEFEHLRETVGTYDN